MDNAFKTFKIYIALKKHFGSDSYDFFRYNGQVSAKPSALERRPDKYYFSKLSRKSNYQEILLANFIENDNSWVGDLIEHEAEACYNRWKARQESLTYRYKNELSNLKSDFNENFVCKGGQHPHLLTLFMRGDVSLETICILNTLVKFRKRWDLCIEEKYLWPQISKKIVKYTPFIKFEKDKMRDLTFNHFKQ